MLPDMFETGMVGGDATFAFGVCDLIKRRSGARTHNEATVVVDNSTWPDLPTAPSQVRSHN